MKLAIILSIIIIASSQDIDDFEEEEDPITTPEPAPTPEPVIIAPIANQVAQSDIPLICISLAAFAMLYAQF